MLMGANASFRKITSWVSASIAHQCDTFRNLSSTKVATSLSIASLKAPQEVRVRAPGTIDPTCTVSSMWSRTCLKTTHAVFLQSEPNMLWSTKLKRLTVWSNSSLRKQWVLMASQRRSASCFSKTLSSPVIVSHYPTIETLTSWRS